MTLNAATLAARDWLKREPLYLDTETTGLDETAQIVEIAILDAAGNALLNERIKPSIDIDAGAEGVHGINAAALIDCPSWPEIAPTIEKILKGRTVVIFNAEYDSRILRQTAAAFNDPLNWFDDSKTLCAMYLAADMYGATNRYGTISLLNACSAAGVKWRGNAHSALADTYATFDLVQQIAR